jgi:protein-disulfide isomerase
VSAQQLVEHRRAERRALALVAVALVLLVVGVGIGLQAWRTMREPNPVPADEVVSSPAVSLRHGEPIRIGSPAAPVTLTLYEDVRCPHCADLEEEVAPVVREALRSETVVLELYPMAFVDEASTRAANALGCAAEAGFSHGYHAGLFANSSLAWSTDQLQALAGKVTGQVPDGFAQCVTAGGHRDWVRSVNEVAAERGIAATPAMFLDGKPVDVSGLTPAGLRAAIDQASQS